VSAGPQALIPIRHFPMALLRVCTFLTMAITLLPATIFAQNEPTPFVNFQVVQPLTLPKHVHKCELTLVHHNFANSYYAPAIVQYMSVRIYSVECRGSDLFVSRDLRRTAGTLGPGQASH